MREKLSILFAALLACTMSFAVEKTTRVQFGKTTGCWYVLDSVATLTDASDMVWTMVTKGTTKFTASSLNGDYFSQIGTSSAPATSITLTGKAASAMNLTSLSVKMGGASSSTKGTVVITVNGEEYVTGGLNGAADTIISAKTAKALAKDQTIVISVSNIARGVKFYSVTYTYEVSDVVATGIKLNKENATLAQFTKETLTATLTPEGATSDVVWTSSDETVAKVSNGVVSAMGVGTADITATAGSVSAKCAVTVTAATKMTCAAANAADDKASIVLNDVTVAYVNGSYVYVKDATGYALIYKYGTGLKAGDVLKDVVGTMSIYRTLPEIVPSSDFAWTVTEGTAPEFDVLATAPTAADVNKCVVIKGIQFTKDASFSADTYKTVDDTVVIAETNFRVYNGFKITADIKAANAYNVTAAISIYDSKVQLYPISIEQAFTVAATANDETMGTVKGAGFYAKDAEATLTATAKKGYQFVGWSDGTTANPYTFTVTADVNLTANFGVTPKHIYAYNLKSTLEDGVYTFSFSANEDATSAAILFYDADSSKYVGEQELTNVVKGENTCTIKEDSLPGENNQNLVWTVKLSAGAVNAFTEVYADEDWTYCRAHSNVDVNPESDFFGQVYVADRVKTKANSRFYVYSPDYVTKDAAGYQLGESIWDFGRFAISETGLLYLSDYGDAHSGIYVVNPADLTTTTQFFAGERESSGLWKNGDVETGSSVAACSFVGTGKDTKLVAVAEDYTGYSFPVAVYNVGQEDGTIATSWTTAPTKLFDTKGNAGQNFDIKGCAKGVWVATSRADGQNNSSATSLRFYDWDGNCTWSSADHTDVINGSLGGGVALTATEGQVILKAEGTTIKVFDITWVESTPTLTLSATYDCGYAAVSTINMDYAGNMVVIGGTAFGSSDTKRMKTAVFSVPTTDNTCEVPAKKAMVVTKKVAEESYIDNTTVEAAQTKKIVRNGQVLIIRDGKTYNMMGQVIE